jgi:uncharacterized membrane protein
MSEPLPVQRQRYLFIDLYRSAVILLMLEGHVFRTLLSPELQQGKIFQVHEFLHGLSAPAFLFGAGLTFVISTRKRWEAYHHWGTQLARRVRRLIVVLLLGLMLHLPYFSIRKIIIDGTTSDYLQLFQFDVLHCIAIGLLSLHALVFLFKSEARFYGLVLTTIIVACFLTPLMWDVDFLRYLPAPFVQMFNGNRSSPFPLFPYVGFLFAGVIVSWEFLIATEKHRERQFMQHVAAIGALLIVAGIVFDLLPVQLYPTYNYWFTSPNYFFIRAGSLMMIVAGFWFFTNTFQQVHPLTTVLGRESLFVYVLHLIVLYGTAANTDVNIRAFVGTNLGVTQATEIFVLIVVTMLLAAYAWHVLKQKQFNYYRVLQLVGSCTFLYYLFTRDF